MKATSREWRQWFPPLYGAVLFLAYAVVILWHPLPPPLGDFADWVYQGVLLARHLHGLPDAAHALKHYPVPNSTATVLLGLLAAALPWAIAAKVFLCLELAIAWWAIANLACAAKTSSWIWWIAPSAFFLNVNFWFGLIAFQLGLAILFFFLAAVLRDRKDRSAAWQKSGLLLLLFFTHMVPFTFACLVLVCMAITTRRLRLLWAMAPPAIMLAFYMAGRWTSGNPDMQVVPQLPFEGISYFLAYKLNTVLKSFGFVNPGDVQGHSISLILLGRGGFILLLLANFCVCGGVLWLVYIGFKRHWLRSISHGATERRQSSATAVWVAIVICLPVYLLLPRAMLGISDPGSRVLQTALYVALFLSTGKVLGRPLIAWAATAMAASGFFLFVHVGFDVNPKAGASAELGLAQRLATVPYASVAGFYDGLASHNYETPVFPTGLFVNVSLPQ